MSGYKAPIAIHPGETLKEILVTEKMSQIQLSGRTGLHPVTISNILSGRDPILPDTALRLSLVFNI
jgi:plasmid maintenance system antidote protein VapI